MNDIMQKKKQKTFYLIKLLFYGLDKNYKHQTI